MWNSIVPITYVREKIPVEPLSSSADRQMVVTVGQTMTAYVVDKDVVYNTKICFQIENICKSSIHAIR